MKDKNLNELTDQELLEKGKKLKTEQIINAALIGFLIGISVYSVVKNGFGFFTFFPLFFVLLIGKKQFDYSAINKELKARNLK